MRTSLKGFPGWPFVFFALLGLCLWSSCASGKLWLNSKPPFIESPKEEVPAYTIYAIGDAGEDNDQSRAVMQHLASQASDDQHPGMVIFLGDNIYPAGLADPSDASAHHEGMALLRSQIDALQGYNGQIIFIPGNHDWNEFKPGGLDAIRRQGEFLKGLNDFRVRMWPENGCGGPILLQLSDQAVMIIIDSQWWIQKWDKEKEINAGCPYTSREAMMKELHQLIQAEGDKQIFIACHHPIMTQGHHGGHFTVKDHLFPLTKVVKWLWVPLPVIGSIYPGYRSIIGHPQDLKHPRYGSLRDEILDGLEYDGELIFLSGHDHNLQYLLKDRIHVLLSGAGAKQNFVADGKDLIYGHKAAGYMQVDLFSKGVTQLTVYEVNVYDNSSKIVFRKSIVNNPLP